MSTERIVFLDWLRFIACFMVILVPVFAWVKSWEIATPLTMIISAAITYFIGIVVTRLLSFIPKSKYIIG